jgi:hypothetical protein
LPIVYSVTYLLDNSAFLYDRYMSLLTVYTSDLKNIGSYTIDFTG